ncbi:MAG: hypothetical protein OEM29_00135 [Thermoplasmata archaeon]|nr:hypothetical protein [Thermoplasmata archaeon]
MRMSDRAEYRADLPRMVGTIGAKAPGMLIRLGFSYLRHKKSTQRAYNTFVRTLESNGVPEGFARELGEIYSSDISVRKLINGGRFSMLGIFK